MTWDGSKGGEFWRTREKKEDEIRSFRKKYEELKVFAVENHKLCFDIT